MSRLLGGSEAMERLRHQIARVAATPLPVLIQGETGSGKEVVARELHHASGRTGPFVPVDCGALTTALVESELFGNERGAFTGANTAREGLVWAATGGTFFLDEIGELPMQGQTRLLRLLENRTYRPVGGTEQRSADIRVIAATWRDLPQRIRDGQFREDSFHRLSIIELTVPPLRERPGDVAELFTHFVAQQHPGATPIELDLEATDRLTRWTWPGNVRELRNAAQYVAAMATGARVGLGDLPRKMRTGDPPPAARGAAVHAPGSRREVRIDLPYMEARREVLDTFQLRYVQAMLDAHDGNISAAARASGMDRRSIQRILARIRSDAE